MRPIRGPRHAADDERTVEAPPEEPTMSAGLDVRAAFEAEDKTMPGAAVGLVPIEDALPAGEQTMPLVSPAVVRDIQASSKETSEPRVPAGGAPPPPPGSQPRPRTVPIPFELPPPSDPVLLSTSRPDEDDDQPIDIPGVGASGAQRKRMLGIVFGILGVCGLLCVAAVARQLLAGNPSTTPAPSTTTTAITTAAATATATEIASPSASGSAAPTAVASPEPSAQPAAPSAPPVVSAVPAPPPPPPVATAAVATPVARAPVADAPPPRRAAPVPAPAPHPRPAAAAPPAGKPKPSIVRDAPF